MFIGTFSSEEEKKTLRVGGDHWKFLSKLYCPAITETGPKLKENQTRSGSTIEVGEEGREQGEEALRQNAGHGRAFQVRSEKGLLRVVRMVSVAWLFVFRCFGIADYSMKWKKTLKYLLRRRFPSGQRGGKVRTLVRLVGLGCGRNRRPRRVHRRRGQKPLVISRRWLLPILDFFLPKVEPWLVTKADEIKPQSAIFFFFICRLRSLFIFAASFGMRLGRKF